VGFEKAGLSDGSHNEMETGREAGPFRRALAIFFAAAIVLLVPVRLQSQTENDEYRVKAAFLFHFAQFVDWPPGTFKEANTPLTYCTLGQDPFAGELDRTLAGKIIGSRRVKVEHVQKIQETQRCQILFVGLREKKSLLAELSNLKEEAVLTVGDSDQFARQGGMIGFFTEENKICFEINVEAAERSKLKISARLLGLAKRVLGSPKGN
jgi:hypothetical protein